jgi:hypothetical protein
MSATLHPLPPSLYPEHLAPVFSWPAVGGPLNGSRERDARCDIDKLFADMRTAWDWAMCNHIAVIGVDADRNGAYLRVVHSTKLQHLFGDECAMIKRHTEAGLRTEIWLGSIEHIRVFWREVTCVF